MGKGFLYLVVVIDWYSRKVLSRRISNTLDTEFCVVHEALQEAIDVYGAPEIIQYPSGKPVHVRGFHGRSKRA